MKLHEWKTRIQSGEHLLGTMVTTFASADLPKILKACGFDFFIIDCEHGSFTTREVADMICVARAIELPGMVRIPELRREHVLHCMELGAAGLLLPNTETAEQARQLVDAISESVSPWRIVTFLLRPRRDFLREALLCLPLLLEEWRDTTGASVFTSTSRRFVSSSSGL